MQQLADEGRLAANTYFVTGPFCAPVPGITQDEFVDCAKVPSRLSDLVRQEQIQTVVLGAAWAAYANKKGSIERNDQRFQLNSGRGRGSLYAKLEDYVRLLRGLGAQST